MNYLLQPDIRLTTASLLVLLIIATPADGQDVDRIVGYQWRNTEGATLRVELRNDHRSDGSDTRLSFLARLDNFRLGSPIRKQSKLYDLTCALRIGP